MKDLKYINKFFIRYKWRFLLGIIFVSISNVFAIYPAKVIRHALDFIVKNLATLKLVQNDQLLDFSNDQIVFIGKIIVVFALLVIALAILKGVFMFFMRQTLIVMSRHIEYDLKNEIYEHYQKLDLAFYKRNNTGDLMNRISEDVGKVRMYIGPAIMYTINLIVLFILVIVTMVQVNPLLTFYVLIPLPFLSVTIYYVSSIINKKSELVQEQQSELSVASQEAFSGIRVIKAYNRQQDIINKFRDECDVYKSLNLHLVKVNAVFHPLMILLIGLSTIITIYVGGNLAIAGDITFGNIAEFVIYVNMLTWPVAAVGWVTSLIQRAAASQKRINEFLTIEPKIMSCNNTQHEVGGTISFKNVSFTYPDSGIVALKNISFDINPGTSMGVIGKTGAGKSTIANLICRLYDIDSGSLSIGNRPIKEVNLPSLRSNIGFVPQDVVLFSDTIRNNIGFGKSADETSDAAIIQAAKDAVVHDNILAFKDQYETIVGERGVTLSGGQKQRISIARSILLSPKILIFDDCLSAVDTETEAKITSNLKRIMDHKTTLIISHRVASVRQCDLIIVLDNGCIIEQGTHETLVDSKGQYEKLVKKQQLEEVKNS